MEGATALVREARLADLGALAALHLQHLEYHARMDPRYLPRPGEDLAAVYRQHLRDPTARVFVATSGEAVVGFSLCRLHQGSAARPGCLVPFLGAPPRSYANAGLIVDLFVHEDYRRQGHGRRLVEASVDWFREQGAVEVGLGVLVDNDLGRQFWESQGFVPYRLQMRRVL